MVVQCAMVPQGYCVSICQIVDFHVNVVQENVFVECH